MTSAHDGRLLRLHLAPFCLSLAGLTALMLVQQAGKQLPELRGRGAPGHEIVEVFVLSVPFIVAVTLPMAVLIAVLRVFTRLSADNEIGRRQWRGVGVLRLGAGVVPGQRGDPRHRPRLHRRLVRRRRRSDGARAALAPRQAPSL